MKHEGLTLSHTELEPPPNWPASLQARSAVEMQEAEHPASFTNFDAEVLSAQQVRLVRRALDKLNENQRHVIELAYFEGLSQTEMAEQMGQPLGTVKTWVRTALKNLREKLGAATITA